jgi:outer membrane protein assembly factor BamB
MRAVAVAVLALLLCSVPAWAQSPGWSRTDLRPVSQPAVVGDRVVLLVGAGGGLRVMALDANSGATVWSRDATTSGMAPGEPPYLAIMGGDVLYLAKRPGLLGAVTAVNIAGGAERWHSVDGYFRGSPAACPEAATAVCVSGALDVIGARDGMHRLDATTGALLGVTALGEGSRDIGEELFDSGDRDPERLIATRGDRVAWSRPLRRIFPAGFTTDYGWSVSRYDALGLFVGSVGSPPRRTARRQVFDLSESVTAGFSTSNGRTKWRKPGWFECATLPCPGADETGYSSTQSPGEEPRIGLRSVTRGTLSYSNDPTSNAGAVSRDARTTLQGFALASGRTLWSFSAGRNLGLINSTLIPPRTTLNTIVLRDARGRLRELDLSRGTSRPAASGTVGWCRRTIDYAQNLGYVIDDEVITDYTGQQSLFPCSLTTGKRVATPAQVPPFLGAIGAQSGNLIVWSDTSAVSATPVAGR